MLLIDDLIHISFIATNYIVYQLFQINVNFYDAEEKTDSEWHEMT